MGDAAERAKARVPTHAAANKSRSNEADEHAHEGGAREEPSSSDVGYRVDAQATT